MVLTILSNLIIYVATSTNIVSFSINLLMILAVNCSPPYNINIVTVFITNTDHSNQQYEINDNLSSRYCQPFINLLQCVNTADGIYFFEIIIRTVYFNPPT